MQIEIPGTLPSLNEIIDAAKTHKMKYRNLKKDATEKCQLVASQLPRYLDSIFLDITYYAPDRRTDPDNIAAGKKFIIDGLVEAGVIENDGWSEIAGWNEEFEKDKENPRIVVEVTEVKDE